MVLLAFLSFLAAPLGCFAAEPEVASKEATEMDDVETTEIVSMDDHEIMKPADWPPKKHKDPFIAVMAAYWDQRIEDLDLKKKAAKGIYSRQVLNCRGCVEV